ncbi:MAG: arginyl-tRNA synthetase [Actinomycetota bacterium]|nr:arginyl-tRNA synthetase [Actinomycetota bacterium]
MAETLQSLLEARVRAAAAAIAPESTISGAVITAARDPQHGDYSSPIAMQLAKQLKQSPLAVAERLAAALDVDGICAPPEVAAPGFVNLRVEPAWLARRVGELVGDDRAGVEAAAHKGLVVVDYSAPNMARQMHVGHLRSTIIGDALAHVYEHLGHTLDRVNHIGDYGAQFGVLLAFFEDHRAEDSSFQVLDPDAFYRDANARAKDDTEFFDRSRQRVVQLQAGEPAARAVWLEFLDSTRRTNQPIYDVLGIHDLEERGESFYAPMLEDVVAELEAKGLLVEDQGAKVVFVPGFTNREGDPMPLIVVNQHGGYVYGTTDLAAIRHRTQELGAERVLYVVDSGQSQHLEMVFQVARMAGWITDQRVEHIGFGLVLGEDGKRLRARTGDNPKLHELLQEAVDRARAFVVERAAERDQPVPDDLDHVARVIGIGAVKYADLSQNRQSNYVFSYEKMLSLRGNTAPYLQYAYARMHSILREAGWIAAPPAVVGVVLDGREEVELALRLAALPDVIDRVTADHEPNHLCAHLFEVSQSFSRFYEACPVLKADEPTRSSRLALCDVSARTLRSGLALLGIDVLERI